MFDHATLRAADLEAPAAFYEGVLRTLGIGYYGAFVLDPDDNNIEVVSTIAITDWECGKEEVT